MKRSFGILFVVLMTMLQSAGAEAHGRSTSYITVTMHGALATFRVKMALLDLNALQATWANVKPPREPMAVLPEAVRLANENNHCRFVPGTFQELIAEHGSVAFEWQSRCTTEHDEALLVTKLHSDLLFDVVAAHISLIRFHDNAGAIEVDSVFTEGRREIVLPSHTNTRSSDSGFLHFGRAGIEHLLTGWDHLAFLLALVLASRSLKGAIVCLTGFTLGHSLTLSMAVLGHAATKTTTVEALIAISILLVALENVWLAEERSKLNFPATVIVGLLFLTLLGFSLGTISAVALLGLTLFEICFLGLLARSSEPEKLRWVSASLFGLLHGFGFAGMLKQMDLPAGQRAIPLASFNIGIEIAQIAVVCLAWPLLVFLKRRHDEKNVIAWGSAVTLAVGMYGCVTRFWN